MKSRLKFLFVSSLVALSIGCGGGGGGSSSSDSGGSSGNESSALPITSNALTPYTGGEILNYKVKYEGEYVAWEGDEEFFEGDVIEYIYSGRTIEGVSHPVILNVTSIEADSATATSNNYYYYDSEGNYRYIFDDDNKLFVNPVEPKSGAIFFPATFKEGDSWTTDPMLYPYDDRVFEIAFTTTVLSKEIASVPAGKFEAYKIAYKIFGTGPDVLYPFVIANIDIDGTVWVHPDIGIVKQIENGVADKVFPFRFSISMELTSVNWNIE